jgi:tRNA U34 5-carboxymethylaminomethyl modifying GTPase MnmE/TrmE
VTEDTIYVLSTALGRSVIAAVRERGRTQRKIRRVLGCITSKKR